MRTTVLFLLIFSLAASAQAQGDFRVVAGTTNLAENGPVEQLTVVNGTLQFQVRPPRNWTRTVDEASKKILFTSESGQSAITVQFTTDSPGQLPEKDELQARAKAEHPGAGISSGRVCMTSYEPGTYFDLILTPAPQVVQRIRQAFVAGPDGDVEFILTASDAEFGKSNNPFMAMLRAFSINKITPPKK